MNLDWLRLGQIDPLRHPSRFGKGFLARIAKLRFCFVSQSPNSQNLPARGRAVSCVVFDESRRSILLVKRRDIPVWVLAGGGIDAGESPEEAAVRELLEETGYVTEIVRKVAEYLPVNRLTQPTYFFECRIQSGKATTSQETADVRFFPLDKLPKAFPHFYKYWIEDALQDHPEVLRTKIRGVSYWMLVKLLILHPILVIRFLLTKIGIHLNH